LASLVFWLGKFIKAVVLGFLANIVGINDTNNLLEQILISTVREVVLFLILNFFGNKSV